MSNACFRFYSLLIAFYFLLSPVIHSNAHGAITAYALKEVKRIDDTSLGEMAEWFKAFAWKADVWLIAVPRVRIPISPPQRRLGQQN
jgi:hypothetical protein